MLVFAGVCFLVSALGTALASSFALFIAFRIVGGVGIGTASVASPLYIGESAPARWRGRLVAVNHLAIVLGMLFIYFVNYRIHASGSKYWNQTNGWRWMFASGCVPAVILLALLVFVPETARFLLMKGRSAEAERVARSTGSETFLEIVQAEAPTSGKPSRLGPALTMGLVLAVLQQATGINVFFYYAPSIFERVTHSVDASLLRTVLLGLVNVLFTVAAMIFVDRLGRKPLLLAGSAGMMLCLLFTGWNITQAARPAFCSSPSSCTLRVSLFRSVRSPGSFYQKYFRPTGVPVRWRSVQVRSGSRTSSSLKPFR